MNSLFTVETADLVVSQTVSLVRGSWDSLNEANHGLVAFRVEFVVVACLQIGHHSETRGERVRSDVRLDSVLEVGQEPESIL